jgi:hypothetical protein
MPSYGGSLYDRDHGAPRRQRGRGQGSIAEGRSPEELEADLIARYSDVLKRPELTVVVLGFSDRIEVGNIIGRGAQRVPFGKHLGYFLDLSLLHR